MLCLLYSIENYFRRKKHGFTEEKVGVPRFGGSVGSVAAHALLCVTDKRIGNGLQLRGACGRVIGIGQLYDRIRFLYSEQRSSQGACCLLQQ